MDQKSISSRLVQGIINARAKVNCASKSSANLTHIHSDVQSPPATDGQLKRSPLK